MLYKGSAPILITCKLEDLEWLESRSQIDPNTGRPWNTDASMLLRRLKVHKFTQRVPKPRTHFSFCGCCFAQLLEAQAAAWATAARP